MDAGNYSVCLFVFFLSWRVLTFVVPVFVCEDPCHLPTIDALPLLPPPSLSLPLFDLVARAAAQRVTGAVALGVEFLYGVPHACHTFVLPLPLLLCARRCLAYSHVHWPVSFDAMPVARLGQRGQITRHG